MYFPMYFDPTYVLVILGVIICLAASAKMRSTFNKYSRVRSRTGMTGREAAEYVLRSAGIYDGHTINLSSMKEYFAEGYREFYADPENLKAHDPDLYDYIRELLHDQE